MKNDRFIRGSAQHCAVIQGSERHQLGIGDVFAGVFIGIANID